MTDERLILLSQRFSKHLIPHDNSIISDYLKKTKDEDFITLQTVELKSPTIGLVLAWFLGAFGGGAFYAKKIGFGIAQIIVWIIYMASYIWVLLEEGNEDFGVRYVLLLFSILCFLCLIIISLVYVAKWVKKYNFQKLMEILSLL